MIHFNYNMQDFLFHFFLSVCSHTAIEAPERCVFGQMVNIGAVMCK